MFMMNTKNLLELAGAVILNSYDEVLLIHRNSSERVQWEIPGGKIEKDESARSAAIRELKEELDVDISISKYLGCNNSLEDDLLLKYHLFLASIVSGSPRLLENKFDKIDYFSKSELKNMDDLSTNMKMLVKKLK